MNKEEQKNGKKNARPKQNALIMRTLNGQTFRLFLEEVC